MKKTVTIILVVILVVSVIAAGASILSKRARSKVDNMLDGAKSSTTLKTSETTTTTTKKKCDHELTEYVYKEAKPGIGGMNYATCKNCDYIEYIATPALPAAMEIKIIDKYTHETDDKRYILFDIEIKNISEQYITEIKGNFNILCKTWVNISFDIDNLNVAPGETFVLRGQTVEFDPADSKNAYFNQVYETPFEEMTFDFKLSDIVLK
jgi:hypothetical protein